MKSKASKTSRLSLLTTIAVCGSIVPAWSQSLYDVFFLTDTTGSMGGLIDGVQSSSTSILDSFLTGRNVTFGVGEYKDGSGGDPFGLRYNLTSSSLPILSADRTLVADAIGQWSASGGGDTPEDNLYGLRDVASSVPWRAGSRRIIYWFGDATGHDPASDGTTLATTLAALSSKCVQVVAIDLGDLDGTGQATAITTATLACGRDGGEIVELDISDLTPEEASALILKTLADSFDEVSNGSGQTLVLSGNIGASIALSRSMTRDVGGRLFRMRAGIQPEITTQTTPPPPPSAKGGMAKGGVLAPVTTTTSPQWEVWGQMFYSNDSQDARSSAVPGGFRLASPQTDTDIFGGTIGAEYQRGAFAFGLALSYGEADVDLSSVADSDIDSLAIIPYVSYYRSNVFSGADFYADALYAYSALDYDINRISATGGSTDGSANQLEFNTGLNFHTGKLVHGPFGQLRWLDGEIDGFTEGGSGGMTYPDADYESLATQLGYQVSYPIKLQGGVLAPQLTAAWEHEFEDDQGNIAGLPLGEVDSDLAVLGVGVGYYLSNGWNFLANYEARLGSDNQNHYVGIKVGKEF